MFERSTQKLSVVEISRYFNLSNNSPSMDLKLPVHDAPSSKRDFLKEPRISEVN